MKYLRYFILVFLLGAAAAFGVWYFTRGLKPSVLPPPSPAKEVSERISVPPGYAIEVFARDLPGARVMALDKFGNMWVSQTSQGVISLIEIENEKAIHSSAVFKNLNKPHGLAFDPADGVALYFAEEQAISKVTTYSDGSMEKIADLPSGGGHFTRTLGFGPDGRLYVSIGSSCNVCHEADAMRAKIFSMKNDGTDLKEFARGLRNSVFFVWNPGDGKMWATEMGRDNLGDELPPDEINIIEEGKNYGWPNCYGKNIHDVNFDRNTYIRNPCMEPFETSSRVDIPAHSAPLGLAFIPGGNDLLVAYHGSWNRTESTGYKIVRVKFDPAGGETLEDFATGWLDKGDRASGRPVDILALPGGVVYVSDDKAGVIYKIYKI